jgi:RNA polymerase sigma factor (sigma-70 family)
MFFERDRHFAPLESEPTTDIGFDEIDHRERMDIVREIIARKLTAREQQILSLVYVSGFNFPEVGERLGVTRSAISATHAKALRKIKFEVARDERLLRV